MRKALARMADSLSGSESKSDRQPELDLQAPVEFFQGVGRGWVWLRSES
jgi:hypothetical protein